MFKEVIVSQNRGPTLYLKDAELLCEEHWETNRNPALSLSMQVYETGEGSLVAVKTSRRADGHGFVDVDAEVVDKEIEIIKGEQAAWFQVLDHFDWDKRAVAMVEDMDIDLTVEVK